MKKQERVMPREIRNGRKFALSVPTETLSRETLFETLANKKGFTAITIIKRNIGNKKMQERNGRNFVKISTHYVVLGNHKFSQEEIEEFANKTPRYAHEQLMKNINYYENGTTQFIGYYNNNRHFRSTVEYVDLNTNEIFTKREMIEMGYIKEETPNTNPFLKVGIENIVAI